jgi:hypothetical protein
MNPFSPYENASNEYSQWGQQAIDAQKPFYDAGVGGLEDYQSWLEGMQDPAAFINNLMKDYTQSAYAKNLTQQAMRAGTNAASASGLTGSTPFAMQMQQSAGAIASKDMQRWLSNVLGINSEYGHGERDLAHMGQQSANHMSNIFMNMGKFLAEMQYAKEAAGNKQRGNIIGDSIGLISMFL